MESDLGNRDDKAQQETPADKPAKPGFSFTHGGDFTTNQRSKTVWLEEDSFDPGYIFGAFCDPEWEESSNPVCFQVIPFSIFHFHDRRVMCVLAVHELVVKP